MTAIEIDTSAHFRQISRTTYLVLVREALFETRSTNLIDVLNQNLAGHCKEKPIRYTELVNG